MREETRQDIISAEEMGTKYDEAAKEIWKNTVHSVEYCMSVEYL